MLKRLLPSLFLAFSAFILSSCAVGPQMAMSVPSDSSTYANLTVYLHELGGESTAADSFAAAPADFANLISKDSAGLYAYKIGPGDIVQVVV